MDLGDKCIGRTITSLPEDLVLDEIVPRLPSKSVIRFKRVSKKWYHRIAHDPRFASIHLLRHRNSMQTIFSIRRSGHSVLIFDHSRKKARFTNLNRSNERLAGLFSSCDVVGSCHGLVCLELVHSDLNPVPIGSHRQHNEMVLWNPETGEFRSALMPCVPKRFYLGRVGGDYPVYGFGFDPLGCDYKAVRVFPSLPTVLDFDVYSRNSGIWRRLETSLNGYTVYDESHLSVLMCGCLLYWLVLAVEENEVKRRCVLSFDLRTDEFRIIDVKLDNCVPYEFCRIRSCRSKHRLIKWKEDCIAYLSFFPNSENNFRVQVILDRNGDLVVGQNEDRDYSFFGLFCGVSCGRFVMVEFDTCHGYKHLKFVMYDPFTRDYEITGRREASFVCYLKTIDEVWDFVPSLVSVYPNQKGRIEEYRKAEIKFWVDMFWKKMGLTKNKFGISIYD